MKNILLVEDDRITSKLIQKYIYDIGYNLASAASSPEEALEVIEKKQPDLILMDINLEGNIDGIEFANSISSKYTIPFVYITSSVDYSTIERAKKSNAYGYIIKPFDKRDLRAAVEMAFLRHEMERRIREDEKKMATILNSIVDMVVVVDSDGYINYINAAGLKMLAKERDFVIGKPISEIVKIGSDPKEDSDVFFPMSMNYIEFNNYLKTNGKSIPVDFTSTPLWMENGKLKGAVLVIRDITQQVEYDKKIQESMEILSRAMHGTVDVITKTVESRDPYTAGHQKNVADIATEIAKFMGLKRDVVEGVKLAGQIHDLGKIGIPAEILNKPGRISEIEFALIKTHSQIGYDILKNIDFPWPVADIVLQHHEKINGSGYPNGLKGEEILIEAKIIAVADVLEAMASHRPYRAALGLEVAFAELEKHKGTLFDEQIVEACILIFKDKGFRLKF